MPIIAEHCLPDGWRGKMLPHAPSEEWPEETYVQWGGGERGGYFFEAYPPETYLHTRGESVAAAEVRALSLYRQYRACAEHRFGRFDWRNGGGRCRRCGMFKSKAFRPIVELGSFRKQVSDAMAVLIDDDDAGVFGADLEERRILLRYRKFGSVSRPKQAINKKRR